MAFFNIRSDSNCIFSDKLFVMDAYNNSIMDHFFMEILIIAISHCTYKSVMKSSTDSPASCFLILNLAFSKTSYLNEISIKSSKSFSERLIDYRISSAIGYVYQSVLLTFFKFLGICQIFQKHF